MIMVGNLQKTYGDFPTIVGSDFSTESDEVLDIVGPSGVRKTTALEIPAGFVEPAGESASVLGYDPEEPAMRYKLGFFPGEPPLYEDMTARLYLRFSAGLYNVSRDVTDKRTDTVLDRFGLEYRGHRLGDISKGVERKIAIARSLVNDLDLLIYDESAGGLGPLTMNVVLKLVRELHDENRTIVFSAHNLFHVESICDRAVTMSHGEIIARGMVPEVRAEHGKTIHHVLTTIPLAEALPDGDKVDGREHHVAVVDGMSAVESFRERVEAAGGRVASARTGEASLEDIFLCLAREASTTNEAGDGRGQAVDGERGCIGDEHEQCVAGSRG